MTKNRKKLKIFLWIFFILSVIGIGVGSFYIDRLFNLETRVKAKDNSKDKEPEKVKEPEKKDDKKDKDKNNDIKKPDKPKTYKIENYVYKPDNALKKDIKVVNSPEIIWDNDSESVYYWYIPITKRIFKGQNVLLDNYIEIFDSNNQSNYYPITYEYQNQNIYENTLINGIVNVNNQNFNVKVKVYVENKVVYSDNDYRSNEDGLTIDKELSISVNQNNLDKLIDRSGNYANSNSRWDNWGEFGLEQNNNNLYFNFPYSHELSLIQISFWRFASQGHSEGIYPKSITISYSSDQNVWYEVKHQSKKYQSDFKTMGPMDNSNNFNNSKYLNIEFDSVSAKFWKISWEAAVNSNNQKHIIGITDIQFKKLKTPPLLHKIINKELLSFKLNNQKYLINSNEIMINSDNLIDINFSEIEINGANYEIFLSNENETKKVYKIIVVNEENEINEYLITITKTP